MLDVGNTRSHLITEVKHLMIPEVKHLMIPEVKHLELCQFSFG